MSDFLQTIIAAKTDEVRRRKSADGELDDELDPRTNVRSLRAALHVAGISAIAEIKRRSPSKGVLRENLDVERTSEAYESNGAAAVSVLTDQEFFGGSDEELTLVRRTVSLPVLRKDFIVDPFQLTEARRIGADAVLLIVRVLGRERLPALLGRAEQLGLEALVEVHSTTELQIALDSGAEMIGVNNRNLDTFEVSLDTAVRLRERIPDSCVTVAESGIRSRRDVGLLERNGYDGFLVGETLVRAEDPGAKLGQLLGSHPEGS